QYPMRKSFKSVGRNTCVHVMLPVRCPKSEVPPIPPSRTPSAGKPKAGPTSCVVSAQMIRPDTVSFSERTQSNLASSVSMLREDPTLRTKFGEPPTFGCGTRLIKLRVAPFIRLAGRALLGKGVRRSEPLDRVWRENG